MHATRVFTDETAVSPVVGVILMVAVTVVMAGIVGTFALGFGSRLAEPAPQVMWEFQTHGGTVTVVHGGGDPVEASALGYAGAADVAVGATGFTGTVTAGDADTVSAASGETLRVVWRPADRDGSAVVGRYEVP